MHIGGSWCGSSATHWPSTSEFPTIAHTSHCLALSRVMCRIVGSPMAESVCQDQLQSLFGPKHSVRSSIPTRKHDMKERNHSTQKSTSRRLQETLGKSTRKRAKIRYIYNPTSPMHYTSLLFPPFHSFHHTSMTSGTDLGTIQASPVTLGSLFRPHKSTGEIVKTAATTTMAA